MTLTLPKQTRTDPIASLRRYAEANLPEAPRRAPAGQLLDFFLEEIGPAIYNKVILDAQNHIQTRLQERLLRPPRRTLPRRTAVMAQTHARRRR